MYMYMTLYGRIFGGIPKMFYVLCNFLKKWFQSFRLKRFTGAFRTPYVTLFFNKQKPIRDFLNFHHLPKLYIGFNNGVSILGIH